MQYLRGTRTSRVKLMQAGFASNSFKGMMRHIQGKNGHLTQEEHADADSYTYKRIGRLCLAGHLKVTSKPSLRSATCTHRVRTEANGVGPNIAQARMAFTMGIILDGNARSSLDKKHAMQEPILTLQRLIVEANKLEVFDNELFTTPMEV